jgi:5-methyltetrahydrofolate--homocysteine methyltransferase
LTEPIVKALEKRILLFDGAMGTEIQRLNPQPEDFPDQKNGFNDGLTISRAGWIEQIHRSYLVAGADCIETNTFGSNKIKLQEYGYAERTVEFNKTAAQLARKVTKEFGDKQTYVIGSMGPSGYLPSSSDPDLGNKSLDDIQDAFKTQAEGLILGGVDALLIETGQDILEVKIAIEAIHEAMRTLNATNVAIIANVTLDKYGKMLLGTTIQAAYTTISDMGIDVFGLNCSTGPEEMTPSVIWLNEQNDMPILVVPNAGMPENQEGKAVYKMGPEPMANKLEEFINKYERVRIIGGCCGTTPHHIEKLRRILDQQQKN